MPGAALHFQLAGGVLERWRATPAAAPFEVTPQTANAFLHGALGPDMGYFPGAEPLLSRLAHAARTGALCRALVGRASTEAQAAFAWGWVTHVLGDVAIHPLVNEACGERLRGRRTPVWGDAAGPMHLRVETGLDAAWCARNPALLRIRLGPALHESDAGFLLHAFRAAWGAAPPAEAVLRSHRRVSALAGPLLALHGVAAAAVGRARGGMGWMARAGAGLPLRVVSAFCPAGSHARGLFTPLRPQRWLMDEVDGIVEGFTDWFEGHYVSRVQFLRDHCLDTGEVVSPDAPAAHQALAELGAARGTLLAA